MTANLDIASIIWAGVYAALDDRRKAYSILRSVTPFLGKAKNVKSLFLREVLCSPQNINEIIKKYPCDVLNFSSCKLLFLIAKAAETLSVVDYRLAYRHAVVHGLLGAFHRYILFIPDPVVMMLRKGKSTGLPRRMLQLPVFNSDVPVYRVNFLGPMRVYYQRLLRIKLLPKDAAFLIHLALKAQDPNKRIPVEELYENFWKGSKDQARNLSHLLVRLRKLLKIPPHLLHISHGRSGRYLVNRGIYFTTDYQEFERNLIQASALQRVGEWYLARKEFVRAFNLVRGDVFDKMYDSWSDDMRAIILNKYVRNIKEFVDHCLGHKDRKTAEKVLIKACRTTKRSQELKKLKEQINIRKMRR